MNFAYEKIKKTASVLKELSVVEKNPIEKVLFIPTEYKKRNSCPAPDESWMQFNFDDFFDGVDKHYWLYMKIKPQPCNNKHHKLYLDIITGRECTWDATNPQALVFLNGEAVQGLDTNHTDVELEFEKEYDLHIYLYTGMVGGKFIFEPSLKIVDTKIEQLYYDIQVPYDSLPCIDENDDNAVTTCKYLELACNMLDLRLPYSDEFYNSIESAAAFLKDEYYNNRGVCGKSDCEISCIGHTHIDIAWLWTLDQTAEKVQRSFATVLKLMDEYDDYIFMSSQPQLYEYLKEYEPTLYKKLKERVKEGRFEPEGAMWVEADCNLSSGESLIRQIMFGKKFFLDEFGIDSKILWLPDVFGYSSALPQILTKCGVEKFVTSKISWNDTNQLPYDIFMWEGIDGTEIFTAFITAQPYSRTPLKITTYNGDITPAFAKGTRDRLQQKAYTNKEFIPFGYGDGGGGPVRKMLEYNRRLKHGLPGIPKTVIEPVSNCLDKIESDFKNASKQLKKTPKWVGELYLEFHRGTYTSIAKNKKNNRKNEYRYQTAEQLSITTERLLDISYPQEAINNGWKTILLNQFHDIIPGSSIEEVYIESDRQYKDIADKGNDIINNALAKIAAGIDKNTGYMVYNPNSFSATGYVKTDNGYAFVNDVPPLGWKTLSIPDYSNTIRISGSTIENRYYNLSLDENANICSLYDKLNDREIIQKGCSANVLEAFEDHPYNYDNWELSPYYKQKKWVVDNVLSITPISEGGRSGFIIKRSFLNSTIIQKLFLYEYSAIIDFETTIDWKENNIVLKSVFPVNIHTGKAVYDTQFGYVERPTHENTPYDSAKFEVCAHKYADISEDDYGVAIINDCKYGYNAEGNTLKLTLLKSGIFPNKNADNEIHTFTYSLLPHIGNHKEGKVIQKAYLLNRPLTMLKAKGNGSLPNSFSSVVCDKENIIIETVKKAEASDAIIIRAYDSYNRRCNATFTFGFDIKKAYLCNMLENDLKELEVCDNAVKVDISTFEILTIKVM